MNLRNSIGFSLLATSTCLLGITIGIFVTQTTNQPQIIVALVTLGTGIGYGGYRLTDSI